VVGENKRGEDVSRKRMLVPSAASVGRRGSRQERNRESLIHFAGKVGVNGGNIEESALTRELGVRHIVGGTQGKWKALVASHHAWSATPAVTGAGVGRCSLHRFKGFETQGTQICSKPQKCPILLKAPVK